MYIQKIMDGFLPKENRLEIFSCLIAILTIFTVRLFVSNLQVDEDEELYYEIAKYWDDDFLPYRDLYDHKPPLVYFYYKVFSLFGFSISFVRISSAIFLLWALTNLRQAVKTYVPLIFVSVVYGLLCSGSLLGTNTEIIYTPFVLGTFVLAKNNRPNLAALFAAIAINIKYTVVFDLTGIGLFLFFLTKDKELIRQIIVRAIIFSSVIFAIFYQYFIMHDINIIKETILVNMQHASDKRVFIPPLRYIKSVIFLCFIALLNIKNIFKNKVFLLAGGCWYIMAFLQANVTGTGYTHYFIPSLVPLAIIVFYHFLSNHHIVRQYSTVIINALVIALILKAGFTVYKSNDENTEKLALACQEKNFHYHGSFYRIYRECDVRPKKYMFVAFYENPHFISVSGSGGPIWLESITDTVISVLDGKYLVFSDGKEFYKAHYLTK